MNTQIQFHSTLRQSQAGSLVASREMYVDRIGLENHSSNLSAVLTSNLVVLVLVLIVLPLIIVVLSGLGGWLI